MDKWIVAVAAGAGYIAQHFKNLKKDSDQITSQSSSENSDFVVKDDFQVKNECYQCVSSTEEASTSDFDGEKGVFIGDFETDLLLKPLTPNFGYGCSRNRRILRSKRASGRDIRPLSALESCVSAHLFKEHVEMEDYMFSVFDSPSVQTVRPFVVTDGSKVISRASEDVFVVQNRNVEKKLRNYVEENDFVCGVPPLPNRGGRLSDSTTMATGKHFSLSIGSSHETLLLCLGVSVGIISSFMSNKRELEKLNRLLKQTENLVQDLHEELEMKDSLIVQELTVEDDKPQQRCNNVSFEHNLEESTHYDNQEFIDQKAKNDSLSKIEAELEAELEMLELSMTSSSIKGRFSNLVEIEPNNGSGPTPIHPANYAVSPRELSLRLHEVLNSQLEDRIRELEGEIEKKQNSNHKSWKHYNNHEDEPVVLNLTGEALDAYNEAYDQFLKISDSEEEDEDDLLHDEVTELGQTDEASGHSGLNWTLQNEKDSGDDEMDKMLIKHIVEKARKGSPVVLNAQRVLFSMDLE